MAALRLLVVRLRGKGRLVSKSTSALLNYTWLVVTIFGPCLPILIALFAVLAKMQSALLLCSTQLFRMHESQRQGVARKAVGSVQPGIALAPENAMRNKVKNNVAW
eukprot:2468668-Amphidinium_carterae.1